MGEKNAKGVVLVTRKVGSCRGIYRERKVRNGPRGESIDVTIES